MAHNSSYDLLSSLLPTNSFTLAYVLPLLFVSVPLTFAGAFLIFDRTRVFPPHAPSRSTSRRETYWLSSAHWTLFLRGGLGGLFSGYTFGVCLATFLSLLLPSTTSSAKLSPKSFLAIWVFAVVTCAAIAGRWNYATLVVSGAVGFTSAALSISVIVHPSLVARIALLAVLATVGTVLCLLPFPRVRHGFTRLACSSAGSFGLVICIAILMRNSSWGNVWERLWINNDNDWGTSSEKGLSAAYCLFLCAGLACDTFLHHRFGENPDEKWDHYLAKFAGDLPNDSHRAGTFTPFVSLYDRIMGRERDFAPAVQDEKPPPDVLNTEKPHFDPNVPAQSIYLEYQPDILRKKGATRLKGTRPCREPVKFVPADEDNFSSEDEDYDPKARPLAARSMSVASSATLTDVQVQVRADKEALRPPSRRITEVPDYSDYEEDLGLFRAQDRNAPDDPNWTPQFIRRHSTRQSVPLGKRLASVRTHPSSLPDEFSSRAEDETRLSYPIVMSPTSISPVPATPSLIQAVDRITAAYTAQELSARAPERLPAQAEHEPLVIDSWNSFWVDVKAKAHA